MYSVPYMPPGPPTIYNNFFLDTNYFGDIGISEVSQGGGPVQWTSGSSVGGFSTITGWVPNNGLAADVECLLTNALASNYRNYTNGVFDGKSTVRVNPGHTQIGWIYEPGFVQTNKTIYEIAIWTNQWDTAANDDLKATNLFNYRYYYYGGFKP